MCVFIPVLAAITTFVTRTIVTCELLQDFAAVVPTFALWIVLCGGVPEYLPILRAVVRTGTTFIFRDGESANAIVLARLPGPCPVRLIQHKFVYLRRSHGCHAAGSFIGVFLAASFMGCIFFAVPVSVVAVFYGDNTSASTCKQVASHY
jgi:hypothetical protein